MRVHGWQPCGGRRCMRTRKRPEGNGFLAGRLDDRCWRMASPPAAAAGMSAGGTPPAAARGRLSCRCMASGRWRGRGPRAIAHPPSRRAAWVPNRPRALEGTVCGVALDGGKLTTLLLGRWALRTAGAMGRPACARTRCVALSIRWRGRAAGQQRSERACERVQAHLPRVPASRRTAAAAASLWVCVPCASCAGLDTSPASQAIALLCSRSRLEFAPAFETDCRSSEWWGVVLQLGRPKPRRHAPGAGRRGGIRAKAVEAAAA